MPRARTGSLVLKPSGYFARMWITREGVERREFVNLETADKALAKRKMAKVQRMLDAGEEVVVIDVRGMTAADGPIPGALRIPLSDLAKRQHEVPRDRDVVLFCT